MAGEGDPRDWAQEVERSVARAKALAPEHTAQLLGYLKSSRLEHGLLINFGSYKFEIRKYAWSPERSRGGRRGAGVISAIFVVLFAFFEVIARR